MDKEVVIYINNEILLSYEKEHIWVCSNEVMNLEPNIQSEVSQTEKYKYCILTHTYGIYKDGSNDLTCRAAKETEMLKNRLLDSAGEGEGGVIWENSTETNMYTTICKTDDQWEFSAWSKAPKASALGQPRGIGWRRRWVGDSGWEDTYIPVAIQVNVWQRPSWHYKVIIHQ